MRKILLSCLFLLTAFFQEAAAQDRTISGRVTDAINNNGLPVVTVLVKSTQAGTSFFHNPNCPFQFIVKF